MRLFVAIDLDSGARQEITKVIDRLGSRDFDVKWVGPDKLHITLKFLGEVHESDVKGVEERIRNVVKDVKGFVISLGDVGYFGSPGYIRVIWVDVKDGRERVSDLADAFHRELSYIRKDDHKPSPHITIGRVKSGRNREELARELAGLSHVKLCEVEVREVKLKQSILRKGGPEYSDLRVFGLR